MIDADYSQIEYRVLTALANNEGLAELFKNPDNDYHTLMASLMFGVPYAQVTKEMRSQAKSFNFGIPYGMGPGSLAILLTGRNTKQTRDEAIEKTELYYANQPNTKKFFNNTKEMAQVNKYTKTQFNRYRYYSFTDKDGNINNAKKAAALRQAGNAVIQGSAADIFKISVARNFSYIRKNKLFGDMLIINMVHDEQLMEINTNKLNIQRIARDVMYNMQYGLDGYPPLFIGAGIGLNWAFAKGGDAEMHPHLLQQLADEADNIPIRKEVETDIPVQNVVDYFQIRIKEFSRQKIATYLMDKENQGVHMHPAIVALLNDKFNLGDKSMSPDELTKFNLEHFIDENKLPVDISWFIIGNTEAAEKDIDEEDEYDEEDEDELTEEEYEKQFTLIDESDKLFGASVQDLIATFGVCLLKQQKVCGIDTRNIYYKVKDAVVDYLTEHICDWEDPDGLEVSFLTDANVLNRTGIKVKNIKSSEIEKRLKRKQR